MNKKRKRRRIVISCFDYTGNMVKPWADAGYECHIIDVQHPTGQTVDNNIVKWGMDVYEWEKMFWKEYKDVIDQVVIAFFFPPCTDLAVSGARWFKSKELKKPGTRKRAMDLIYWSDEIGKKLKCPYFIENPISVISTEWRKPNFKFHPYEYGLYKDGQNDGYKKTTCLWVGGGFILPKKLPIKLDPKTADRIHKMAPSPNRRNLRSQTPKGFAYAVFEKYSKIKN